MSHQYESHCDCLDRDQFALSNLHNLRNSRHKPKMPSDKTKIQSDSRDLQLKNLPSKLFEKMYKISIATFFQFSSKISISVKIIDFRLGFFAFFSQIFSKFTKFYFFKDFRLFKTDSNLKKSLEADLVDLRSTVTQLIWIQSATIKIMIHQMIHFW